MNIWERFFDNLHKTVSSAHAAEFFRVHSVQLAGLAALGVLLIWASAPFKAWERSRYERWRSSASTLTHGVFLSAGRSLVERYALIAFAFWLGLVFWTMGVLQVPGGRIIVYLAAAFCIFRVGSLLAGDLFAGGKAGGVLPLDDLTAGFYRRYLTLFLAYLLVGILAAESAELLDAPAWGRLLLEQVFGVGILGWALLLLRPRQFSGFLEGIRCPGWLRSAGGVKVIRYLVLLATLIVIIVDLLGFHKPALYMVRSSVFTVMIAIAAAVVWLAAGKLLESFLKPEIGWVSRRFPGMGPLLEKAYRRSRLVLAVLLTTAAVVGTLLVWGVGGGKVAGAFRLLGRGPKVGPFKLTPVNIAFAVLLVYLGLWFSRRMRKMMEVGVYPRTNWDEGTRYTFSTIMHYAILIAAGLTALSILGFPLGNIALIAGALGVGIGFGLQSIVRDFVCGLILLFERPIKVGDMLIVDKQWGLVKAIRVRSTIFQTFDGYALIIPNSELLSSKILNWTHFGWGVNRLTLTVGISYGSDVQKATEIITEVCRANPNVLTNPPPSITFQAFADSSLTMNIWAYVATPAVRVPTTHELNSAILRALRKHGIEIPFPQRDIYVKSWPEPLKQEENAG